MTEALPESPALRKSAKWWDELPRVWKLASSAVGLAGLLASYLFFFVPFRDLDLTVWVRQSIPISLPPTGEALPLRLQLGGTTITRANLLDVEILNSGRNPIGTSEARWLLRLRDSGRAPIHLVGRPQPFPPNIEFSDSAEVGAIALRVGLFNVDDRIVLRLLVVDPPPEGSRLEAETRISGLPEPTVTEKPLRDRLHQAFFFPLALPILVLLLAVGFWDNWKRGRLRWNAEDLKDTVAGLFFLSAIGAGLSGYALAWIAARAAVALAAVK